MPKGQQTGPVAISALQPVVWGPLGEAVAFAGGQEPCLQCPLLSAGLNAKAKCSFCPEMPWYSCLIVLSPAHVASMEVGWEARLDVGPSHPVAVSEYGLEEQPGTPEVPKA